MIAILGYLQTVYWICHLYLVLETKVNILEVSDGNGLIDFFFLLIHFFTINKHFKKLHLLVETASYNTLSGEIIINFHDRFLKSMDALKYLKRVGMLLSTLLRAFFLFVNFLLRVI